MKIFDRAAEAFRPTRPEGLAQIVIGGPEIGEAWSTSRDVPLVSATGSTRMGARRRAEGRGRFGRALSRTRRQQRDDRRALGRPRPGRAGDPVLRRRHGRPALHLAPPADRPRIDRRRLARPGSSRPTRSLPIGDPREPGTLVGPLIDEAARERMAAALAQAKEEGGTVHGGGRRLTARRRRRLCRAGHRRDAATDRHRPQRDLRADPLHARLRQARTKRSRCSNDVPQGLSSCIFTLDMREAETFCLAGRARTAASPT